MKDFSRKLLMFIAPVIGYIMMKILWLTTKKSFTIASDFSQDQYIFVCWHGELFMSPQAYRYLHKKHPASAMISHHFDGELIARVYQFLGINAIRGSGRRGAKEVFLKAFRLLKADEELLMTPDGPKGPRHHMYDGAVALSLKGDIPVCIVSFTCDRYWQLNSWDKFVIPKPFASIDFFITPVDLKGMELEAAKSYLREKMLEHTIK